uniref:K+ potassium transporter integral membrane domain-containing protein n=1 Tax=Zea mays TaxID=4577 RepID=A0A804MX51_MAIZE
MPQQAVLVGLTAGMVAAEGKAAGNKTMMQKQQASSCCSDRDQDMADLELALEAVVPVSVQRQDSLYRDATRAGGGGQQQHEGWARTLRLAFQCVGVLYGDIGTSPLYVYSSTFAGGIRDTDDLLGVLSLIIYSFLLFTIIKYVYIALRANDDGDGGTLALYSLISRHAKVSLVPNHQPEDELQTTDAAAAVLGKHGSVRRRTVQLAASHGREQRAVWVKELLETSKPVRISLFFLTIVATAMVISDACLTPAISVLSAVGGLKEKAPNLTTGTAGARPRTRSCGSLWASWCFCSPCSASAPTRWATCSPPSPPVAAPHRRRGRVQPAQARRHRPPRLQPQVHPGLLPAQRQGRLGLPRRRPPLLHRHRGAVRRPRLLQHPLHPAQLRLRPRPRRAARLHRPGRLPPPVPGAGVQRLLPVHARVHLLAHLRAGAGGVGHRQPGHDLLRLRHHLPLAGAGLLPEGQGAPHVAPVPGPALHPGGELAARPRRLRRHARVQDHGRHRRGARHLRRPRHAHHHAAAHPGHAPGVARQRRLRRALLRRLRRRRVRLPLLRALPVRARRVHPRRHVRGAGGRHGAVALRAREAVQVRAGAHGVARERGAGPAAALPHRPRRRPLLHGPGAGHPARVPAPGGQDPVHPRRPALRLRQAPAGAARGRNGALPLQAGGIVVGVGHSCRPTGVPVRGALRLPGPAGGGQ